jgi:crotonobetainyl-CoA:carnitine CoA-transferase CaiB-like acyl-CoA transferase
MTDQTLSDIKVLDLTWYISGPFCTKFLADFGAEIIKVERPLTGDPARSIGPFLNDDSDLEKSLLFSNLNLNKRSIVLDLKSTSGQETVKELVREADILVESFRPGVMKRLGLDYEVLKALNPELIMTSISNFGQSGPYRDFKASELILSGLGADMYSCGLPGRHPLKLGGNCLQYLIGHMAALATIAAYWFRLNTGLGQYLDISMQQVLAADTNHKMTNLVAFAYSGMALTTVGLGRVDPRNFATAIHPTGVYPCLDGYVRAYGGLTHWDRFLELFPQFEEFEYPEDILDVENNKPVVDAAWYEWCSERTKQEIMETCQSVKYWVTAINTPKDFITDPQMKARGFWVEVDHPVTGKQIYPGDPLHAESSPWRVRRPTPLLGQHTREILDAIQKNVRHSNRKINKSGMEISSQQTLPLQGLRVVDMGVIWAGPSAAWLFGALGAEVIHVDNPHHEPDYSRGFLMWTPESQFDRPDYGMYYPEKNPGERPWNRQAFYTRALWNRLSCCIDINNPEGKEVFKRLIKASDVFIENNSASAMENLGLGHEVLLSVNPRLICINMPAWGRNGPYMDYVGIGAMHQAIGGEDWIRGYDDDDHPFHNTFRYPMDSASPPMAVFGAIMALIQRLKTGQGQWIDFAQMQAMAHHFAEIYLDAAWNGRDHKTMGNRHPTAVQGCYLCRGPEPTEETALTGGERWINITITNDVEWEALCRVMRNPPWTKDPKFDTQESRRKHHDEIDAYIESFTRKRDNFELFYVLQEHGVTAGPVEDSRDSHMDPQLNFRNFFRTITGADIGTYRYATFPFDFPQAPLQVTHPPCMLGEDNEYVYRQVIGLSEEEISLLEEKQVIGNLQYDWAGPMPEYFAKRIAKLI